MVSGQFYNNAQCRSSSGVIGPPPGDGGIAIPVRRTLQGGGPGDNRDGAPDEGPGHGEDPEHDRDPEHDHEQPDERGPPEGQVSEVAQFDAEVDICSTSTGAVLSTISAFDSSVAAASTVSYDTYFDFTAKNFGTVYNLPAPSDGDDESSMSATTVLVLWAIAGIVCGYGVVSMYGYLYGTSSNAPPGSGGFLAVANVSGASFIKDAMQETSSGGGVVHSRHGLLSHGHKDVNYEEEEDVEALSV